jgi:hypothetical protein
MMMMMMMMMMMIQRKGLLLRQTNHRYSQTTTFKTTLNTTQQYKNTTNTELKCEKMLFLLFQHATTLLLANVTRGAKQCRFLRQQKKTNDRQMFFGKRLWNDYINKQNEVTLQLSALEWAQEQEQDAATHQTHPDEKKKKKKKKKKKMMMMMMMMMMEGKDRQQQLQLNSLSNELLFRDEKESQALQTLNLML